MTTDKTKRFFRVSAEDFKKIPGSPIAYWISDNMSKIFSSSCILNEISPVRKGIDTGENALFLREWFEVSDEKISRLDTKKKWFFYIKGGEYRKWYGNINLVVNWENDGYEIRHHRSSTIRNQSFFKKEAITWSLTGTKGFAARYVPNNCMFDNNGSSVFPSGDSIAYIISYMNTNIVTEVLQCLNPTIAFQVGDIANIPVKQVSFNDELYKKCISIAKYDWDSYETSWGFRMNPLCVSPQERSEQLSYGFHSEERAKAVSLISGRYMHLRYKWQQQAEEMRKLEIENNRIFIEAYGLQDELSPEVPWNEITLTCNPWYRYGKKPEDMDLLGNSLYINISEGKVMPTSKQEEDCPAGDFPFAAETEQRLLEDTMKEFISYAVGCMMGRYSLEKPGLILANQGEDFDDYIAKVRTGTEKQNEQETVRSGFLPDRDGVLPILDDEWFVDDIVAQFKDFLKFTFGEEAFSRNLAFIEKAIGKDIRKYFMKDFYKEHVQRYKKRPIYWLFSSPKGSFNALIYLHRYRPDTVSIVLNDYLREFMTKLRVQRSHLIDDNNRADLSASEKSANLKRIDKYAAMLAELEDYERDILFPLAQKQLAIDFDDGVKVNYLKFGAALKEIPGLKAREE